MVYVYNMANGNPRDAADLVDYLNAENDGANPWAALRAANGHPEPYNIKNFEIGNEMYLDNQRYWLTGDSEGKSPTELYALGGTIKFYGQGLVYPDDWRALASAVSGERIEYDITTPGVEPKKNEIKYIKFTPVVEGSEEIYVAGIKWTRVTSLAGRGGKENVYTIDYATGAVKFGDGVNGRAPASGSLVTASYSAVKHGFIHYYAAMKKADPAVKVYPCSENDNFAEIMGTEHPYDGVAVHDYLWRLPNDADIEGYHDLAMSNGEDSFKKIKGLQDEARAAAGEERFKNMSFPVTEYGIFVNNAAAEHYLASMAHAMYVSMCFMNFMALGNIPYANKHCLIDYQEGDCLGPGDQAVIGQAPGYIPSATALVFDMFIHMFGNIKLSCEIDGAPVKNIDEGRTLRTLQAVSSRDKEGNVYLIAVNCDREKDITAVVDAGTEEARAMEMWTTDAPSYLSYNTANAPETVKLIKTNGETSGGPFNVTFKASSVTAVKIANHR
jgi:hypothetical protein